MSAPVPARWQAYQCGDYFAGAWWQSGYFDEYSQTLVIMPLDEAYENRAYRFFAVGRSGAGGIDFGYRQGHEGLWALYPIDGEFKPMAPSIQQLVNDWCAGRLSV